MYIYIIHIYICLYNILICRRIYLCAEASLCTYILYTYIYKEVDEACIYAMSSYYYKAVSGLYVCPDTTVYVSSYC